MNRRIAVSFPRGRWPAKRSWFAYASLYWLIQMSKNCARQNGTLNKKSGSLADDAVYLLGYNEF